MTADRAALAAVFAQSAQTARYPIELPDAAVATVFDIPEGMQLVAAQCVLQSGVHLSHGESAERAASLAFCSAAAELAASGAMPAWSTVSLSVPGGDRQWITRFAERLNSLGAAIQLQFIAGPVQRGTLAVSIQLSGLVESGCAMRPGGAQVGDIVYVSGELGAVAHCTDRIQRGDTPDEACLRRWRSPVPRIGMGRYIAEFATGCVNISEGLGQSLADMARLSGVGMSVKLDAVPLPVSVSELGVAGLDLALYGSGDSELCFTAPASAAVAARLANLPPVMGRVTAIGTVDAESGIRGISARAQVVELPSRGWRHFTGTTDIVL